MNILEIKNGCKLYGEGEFEVVALENINLEIKAGEFITILGASGSGKSTLLNVIGGLDDLTSGDIYIGGEKYNSRNDEDMSKFRCKEIGFIFQSYNLIPVFTVYENIVMPIIIAGRKVDKEYINELLELLGIYDKRNKFPNQLSGGQQQRVAIARSLSNKPKIILADEPTGNLDSKNGQDVLDILTKGIKKYNNTLVMVTHNEEIAKKSDRTIVIKNGRIDEGI